MSRLVFASIVTAFLLPGLVLSPPAEGLMSVSPSIGNAAGIELKR